MPDGWRPNTLAPTVAGSLRVDWATAEVLRAFNAAGVRAALLKGVSIARWLYDSGNPRTYMDCDLLVPPADMGRANDVLRGLGFEPSLDERDMPEWWRAHGVEWLRADDGVIVDVHRTLLGVGVDPNDLWDTLSGQLEAIEVAGFPAQALSTPGRAFHLALHAAQHGPGGGHALVDLERAVDQADKATWEAAAELAASVEATPAFAAGLRLHPAGRRLATELGLGADLPVDVALRAGRPPPVALGFDQLARAPGLRARLEILRHKIAPPRTFMSHWDSRAGRGRLHLALAYVRRWLWLWRKAPAGYRAWREARRRPPPPPA